MRQGLKAINQDLERVVHAPKVRRGPRFPYEAARMRLARWRYAANLTRVAVAARAGVSVAHITRLERTRWSPPASVWPRLADAYGMSVDRFEELLHSLVERGGSHA